MKLETLAVADAIGGVLIHNIPDAQGHKALSKGHRLTASDVEKLRVLNKAEVFVGVFEDGDVSENDAATRIANAITGENLVQSAVSGGRINLLAATRGVLKVNAEALARINAIQGITVATIPANVVVEPKKIVATIKTIGLAIPEAALEQVEQIARVPEFGTALIGVRALRAAQVALILTGSAEARPRVEKTFTQAVESRIQELGATIVSNEYVDHAEAAIADAIQRAQGRNVDCVLLVGETSIMDTRDVTPGGIVRAGGEIEVYGAPVEPGNLLLLAYVGELPIIGAPGCVKSRDINVVDLILPRLLVGERLRKADVDALAIGGLLI